MLKRLICLTSLGLAMAACATIVEGSTQTIAVDTPGVSGAQCTLKQSDKAYHVTTPGSVVVDKSKHDMSVTCKMAGYNDGFMVVQSMTEGATIGNLLAGGFIGYGVDAATGASNRYPAQVMVPMVRR